MTVPRGGDGGVGPSPECTSCTQLHYALGPQERAAYLVTGVILPQGSVAVAFDVLDDGGGGQLKLALRNAINEEVLLSAVVMNHPVGGTWRCGSHPDSRNRRALSQSTSSGRTRRHRSTATFR